MPGDVGGGIIIIRRKLSEQAIPSVAPSVKVWHVLAAVALVSFVLGAVIF
jgi:hypothetical protein